MTGELRPAHDHFQVVIVGGGQAGLAAGYYLAQVGCRFVILDAHDGVGDAWRMRWSTLRLFTPARIDGLPGLPFPAPDEELPSRDAMADYLEAYARRFELPVRSGVRVTSLSASRDRYVLDTSEGEIEADQVIVATGANQTPRIPAFASGLDPQIRQLSAADYRDPTQLRSGGVLVVGAGNSGAEIALEAGRDHTTWLSGRDTGTGSPRFFARPFWWFGSNFLTRSTPMGRRLIARMSAGGAPLFRIRPDDFAKGGVERVAKMTGVSEGRPELADGRVLDVRTVVWCTGFGQDFGWIRLPVFDESGGPLHWRGVVRSQPGLYFIGLPFLYRLSSALIGGAGSDARHVARVALRWKPRPNEAGATSTVHPRAESI